MRHGKIELDAEGSPRAAIPDKRLLDCRVRIKHFLAGAFVEAAVDVTTQVRKYGQPKVLVLEIQRAPGHRLAPIGQRITDRIGVVETSEGKEIEWRIRVGWPFDVSRNLKGTLPHANWRNRRRGYDCERAQERRQRLRPERGAKPPSESAWGWGPTRSEY